MAVTRSYSAHNSEWVIDVKRQNKIQLYHGEIFQSMYGKHEHNWYY